MSSPLVVSPLSYGDIPAGGQFALQVISARRPSNTIDKQYEHGYFWLSSLDAYTLNAQNQRVYGDGSLWYQAGNSSGSPNWTIISDGSSIVSILGTTNQITSTNVAGTITLSIPNTFVAPGSVTASVGNITATDGNIVLGNAGNKQVYTSVATTDTAGANSAGTVELVTGTIVVKTTAVTASSLIRLTLQELGTVTTPMPIHAHNIVAGVSFDITSSDNTDTSTVFWEIVN